MTAIRNMVLQTICLQLIMRQTTIFRISNDRFGLIMLSANRIVDYHRWRRNFLLRKPADYPLA